MDPTFPSYDVCLICGGEPSVMQKLAMAEARGLLTIAFCCLVDYWTHTSWSQWDVAGRGAPGVEASPLWTGSSHTLGSNWQLEA